MKELRAVIDAASIAQAAGMPAALATVVAVQGSAYRRPGARMLILADGETVGGVSGGCLEADVIERAHHILREARPRLVTYDTTDEDDILTGVGLGCQGVVQILIEPVTGAASHLNALDGPLRERRPCVLATVCHVEGETETRLGERLLLSGQNMFWCDITDPTLSACVEADAQALLTSGHTYIQRYLLAGTTIAVFLEVLLPSPALLICGAGNDAQPLVQFAKGLGWHVTVADARPAFAIPSRFPLADAVMLSTPEELPSRVAVDNRTAVVVMTHNYLRDRALLQGLLPSTACYIGVLGPKRRTECLRQDLHDEGLSPDDRLHGPVGLDIGAEGPEQIALAIVAEIQAEFAGRPGGPLRHRAGPIFADTADSGKDPPLSSFEHALCPL
jgi:xanthine dehydrogenase accessory factor